LSHSLISFFLLFCLVYILYAGLTATFNLFLYLTIATILIEGVAILLNGWQCPLTILSEKWDAEKALLPIFLCRE